MSGERLFVSDQNEKQCPSKRLLKNSYIEFDLLLTVWLNYFHIPHTLMKTL